MISRGDSNISGQRPLLDAEVLGGFDVFVNMTLDKGTTIYRRPGAGADLDDMSRAVLDAASVDPERWLPEHDVKPGDYPEGIL